MFGKILIANRGEIACRIIRTARRMGVATVAVHSRADRTAMHARLADEAVAIGPAPARQSYLDGERIIAAARQTGAQAVHPGYGFLSENAAFARACADAGLVFIGPPPEAIAAMGLKDRAKEIMSSAGVPVVPGYNGEDQNDARLCTEAEAIGFPVLIKASAGGGGKGMRRVGRREDFADALAGARREAMAAFGNDHVIVEKLIANPRHIEVQIFADAHGNAVHLFERDCSMQRRHQKVIEEAPAPGMGAQMRAAMGAAAVAAARATDYRNAGTVEFIADGGEGLRADRFWFMEMNTRLQVEHPVTEAITGLDLVEWQLRIAAGEPLPLQQDQIRMNGHAIEARLYAEDPARGFLPASGRVDHLHLPDGGSVRIDAGVAQGDSVEPYYDPMIAKVIAHGGEREAACRTLVHALGQTIVAGVHTNASWLERIVQSDVFAQGGFDTGVLDGPLSAMGGGEGLAERQAALAGLAFYRSQIQCSYPAQHEQPADGWISPWCTEDAFQFVGPRTLPLSFILDGDIHCVNIAHDDGGSTLAGQLPEDDTAPDNDGIEILHTESGSYIFINGQYRRIGLVDYSGAAQGGEPGSGDIRAPMHGRIVRILVNAGEEVSRGARLAIVEAMKMEHVLTAPFDGRVVSIDVCAGGQIAERAIIMTLEPGTET